MHAWFNRAAGAAARLAGHPIAFAAAVLLILGWAMTGPVVGYSDTWQLIINTGTTIVTFLIVFLIQNSQNRESAAVQIKLDELIRATNSARNSLLDLEELSETELNALLERYRSVARRARDPACEEISDLGTPEVVHAVAAGVEAAAELPPDAPHRAARVRKTAAQAVAGATEIILKTAQSRKKRRAKGRPAAQGSAKR